MKLSIIFYTRIVGVVTTSFKSGGGGRKGGRGGGRRGGRGETGGGGAPLACLDFSRGKCHHGSSCQFLHVNHNNTDGASFGDLGRGGGRYGSRSGGGGGGQSFSRWVDESSRGLMDGKDDHPRIL